MERARDWEDGGSPLRPGLPEHHNSFLIRACSYLSKVSPGLNKTRLPSPSSFVPKVINAVGRQRRCIPADLDLADAIWTQALAEGFPLTSKTYEARAVCLRLSERWHDLLALLIDEFSKRLQGTGMPSKDLLWQVAVWYTVPSPRAFRIRGA